MTDLSILRDHVDEIDKAMLELIAKRLSIVSKIGSLKSQSGLPLFVPEREALMLKARKEEAKKLNIDPSIIEDVLRRLMRGSYELENDQGFHCVNPTLGDVVIIGGNGQLGQLFGRLFKLSNYSVKIVEKNDWQNSETIFAKAGLVLVCVPIDVTQNVIEKLNFLPKDCILADLTSIKSAPLEAMLKAHTGPVVGLHPMFGPNLSNLAKQVIVYCDGRMPESYAWLLEQFGIWGSTTKKTDAKEHDKYMQLIQALRHFTTFAYGVHLANENPALDQLIEFSSPIYRLELLMVGRLFAQNGELYSDIIMSSPENVEMIKRFASCLNQTIALIEQHDRNEFLKEFAQVKAWFGDYASNFMQESQQMLERNR